MIQSGNICPIAHLLLADLFVANVWTIYFMDQLHKTSTEHLWKKSGALLCIEYLSDVALRSNNGNSF